MLIDRYLPRYDVRNRHEIEVDAPPDIAYLAAVGLDMSSSLPVKVLFGLRSIPRLLAGRSGPGPDTVNMESIMRLGFVVLGEEPGVETVLGVVGKFWHADSGLLPIEPDEFTTFERPGYAKGVMNLRVWPRDTGSRVTTETRVLCTDAEARRKFKLYWSLIGPFSGFIRGEMLRSIKRTAERDAQTSVGSL